MFIINNEIWTVKYVSPYDENLRRSDNSFTVGMCDDNTRTIYLNEFLEGPFLFKVLCHEITHAAMFAYNIELSLEQEELLADLISTYGEEIVEMTNTLFQKIQKKKRVG